MNFCHMLDYNTIK
jgi:hypothetical protein